MKNLFKRAYGWIPDLPDKRDLLFSAFRKIPKKINPHTAWEEFKPPARDQSAEGSCTGHGNTGACKFLELKDGMPFVDLSPQFLYHNSLKADGQRIVLWDRGSQIRTGIKCLAKQGVCTEALWPYKAGDFKRTPSKAAYKDAMNRQISEYFRLNTLDEMRACLSDGFPFVFGFTVYESFESEQVAKTGIVPMPGKNERVLGGHCVWCYGHDDPTRYFLCQNSWGKDWGMDGSFKLPYGMLSDRNISDDFWTVRKGEQI